MKKPDTERTELITCPWCGYEDKESWEAEHDHQEERECGECEKSFYYIAKIEVTWSTWKK